MQLHEVLSQSQGNRPRHRVGRGIGSGNGKTCGRGHKGAGSRSGHSTRSAFEGGQTAMFRRVAKRGYSNGRFSTKRCLVQLEAITALAAGNPTVDASILHISGLIPRIDSCYKIVGEAKLTVPIRLVVDSISRGARQCVIAAGGQVESC